MFCGNRIFEVTTATLGPLPLDQLPKSKPVTPYAVSLIVPANPDNANPPRTPTSPTARPRSPPPPPRPAATPPPPPAPPPAAARPPPPPSPRRSVAGRLSLLPG